MGRHRRPGTGRNDAVEDRTVDLWRRWLEASERPPPLDRWMRSALRDAPPPRGALYRGLRRTARLAAPALALATGRDPHDLPLRSADLVDALRRADPLTVVRMAAALDGDAVPDAPRAWAVRDRWAGSDDPLVADLAAGIGPGWSLALAARRARWRAADARAWRTLQGAPPSLWLRPQGPGAARALEADGFRVRRVEGALQARGSTPIRKTRAWREGLVEVQDLGSQLAGRAVPVAPGQVVWDACAGAGGKTLQLAAALEGRGAVHATDVDTGKLDRLRRRVRRAGLADHVRVRPWSGDEAPRFGPEVARRGGFDAILVDAPCSSTGTWRRNPDARLRTEPDPSAFTPLQRRIVDRVLPRLRPGGHLVYVTCSVLVAEDEALVEAVGRDHPGLTLETAGLVGAPDHDADTLFVARWRLAPASEDP